MDIPQVTIKMLEKVTVSLVVGCLGGFLFVKFIYRVFIKYFDAIEKIKSAIWGSEDNPEGIEHRLTVVETKCLEREKNGVCSPKRKRRQ